MDSIGGHPQAPGRETPAPASEREELGDTPKPPAGRSLHPLYSGIGRDWGTPPSPRQGLRPCTSCLWRKGKGWGTPPNPRQGLRPCIPMLGGEGEDWGTPPSPRQGLRPCTSCLWGVGGHPRASGREDSGLL